MVIVAKRMVYDSRKGIKIKGNAEINQAINMIKNYQERIKVIEQKDFRNEMFQRYLNVYSRLIL